MFWRRTRKTVCLHVLTYGMLPPFETQRKRLPHNLVEATDPPSRSASSTSDLNDQTDFHELGGGGKSPPTTPYVNVWRSVPRRFKTRNAGRVFSFVTDSTGRKYIADEHTLPCLGLSIRACASHGARNFSFQLAGIIKRPFQPNVG